MLAKLERDLASALPDVDLREDRVAVFTGHRRRAPDRGGERGARAEWRSSKPRSRACASASAKLQAALVALEPATGAILAYVGGSRWSESQFDHVAQARRQPGSAFKPIVLLAALVASRRR